MQRRPGNSEKEKSEMNFEEKMKKLDELVANMEGGKMNLDDMIKSFEEGRRLVEEGLKDLEEIRQKIEKITGPDTVEKLELGEK